MEMKTPYNLKPYTKEDFADKTIFMQGTTCAVCGHHLPLDQVMQVSEDYVHTDVRICLALIKESGRK